MLQKQRTWTALLYSRIVTTYPWTQISINFTYGRIQLRWRTSTGTALTLKFAHSYTCSFRWWLEEGDSYQLRSIFLFSIVFPFHQIVVCSVDQIEVLATKLSRWLIWRVSCFWFWVSDGDKRLTSHLLRSIPSRYFYIHKMALCFIFCEQVTMLFQIEQADNVWQQNNYEQIFQNTIAPLF